MQSILAAVVVVVAVLGVVIVVCRLDLISSSRHWDRHTRRDSIKPRDASKKKQVGHRVDLICCDS